MNNNDALWIFGPLIFFVIMGIWYIFIGLRDAVPVTIAAWREYHRPGNNKFVVAIAWFGCMLLHLGLASFGAGMLYLVTFVFR